MKERPIVVDPQVAIDKLFSLDSPLAIAEMLRGEGIKGVRCDAEYCPIATWLERISPLRPVGGSWQVSTTEVRALMDLDEESMMVRRSFDPTEAVRVFVREFDGIDEHGDSHTPKHGDLVTETQSSYDPEMDWNE